MNFESQILDIKDQIDNFIETEGFSSCLTNEDFFRFMKAISNRISDAFESIL